MPTDICEAKRMLRKEILSKRRHLGEEICQTFGRQFAERIVGLDEYKAADTILCYASCKGEADTWKLIEKALEAGKRVALPRVTGPAEMHFYKITSMKDVATDIMIFLNRWKTVRRKYLKGFWLFPGQLLTDRCTGWAMVAVFMMYG